MIKSDRFLIVKKHFDTRLRIFENHKKTSRNIKKTEEEIKTDKQCEIYKKRLKHEIKIISEMNYSSYFLIVSDYIKWAKKNNIPVGPGRGSGAGS